MAENISINGRIAQVRRHLGVTQAEFSGLIGISRSFLGQVEAGQSKPSIEAVSGIAAKCTEISTRWLLTGQGQMLEGIVDDKNRGQNSGIEEIQELRILGRVAPQALAWRILNLLETQSDGLTLDSLKRTIGISDDMLLACLIGLKRENRISLDNGRYRIVTSPRVKAETTGDVGAAIDVSLRTLLDAVLPHLKDGQAGVLLSELRVSDLDAWLKVAHASTVELIQSQDRHDGVRVRILLATGKVDSK